MRTGAKKDGRDSGKEGKEMKWWKKNPYTANCEMLLLLVKALKQMQKDKLLKVNLYSYDINPMQHEHLLRLSCFSTGYFVVVSSKGQPVPSSGTYSISHATESRQKTTGTQATREASNKMTAALHTRDRSVIRQRTDIA